MLAASAGRATTGWRSGRRRHSGFAWSVEARRLARALGFSASIGSRAVPNGLFVALFRIAGWCLVGLIALGLLVLLWIGETGS